MATLKGVWTIGKKLLFKDIGEQLLNGTDTSLGESFAKIVVAKKVDSWGDTILRIAWYDAEGKWIRDINRYSDVEGVEDTDRHYTFDLGNVEQTVSDEFYEWWTSSFVEFTPEKVLGSWKFSDDILVGFINDTTMLFEDAQGNKYDQIRESLTDMGDKTVEAHSVNTGEWTLMFTIPF